MPTSPEGFERRIDDLRRDLASQGGRVLRLLESAFDAFFARDGARAQGVEEADNEIDRIDVEIERAAVSLLTDATREGAQLEPTQLRQILTIVKVNNELERVADVGVSIAQRVSALPPGSGAFPPTLRVMTNSVLGIVRDSNLSVEHTDGRMARVVLQSEDAVAAFKAALLRGAEEQIASGKMAVDFAFNIHELATRCEDVADHCTNIAEQILYLATGTIMRHMEGHWVEIPPTKA
jgi:phosphate transport system protein